MLLTEAQELVRDTARHFAQTRLAPNARAWEDAGAIPPDVLRELGERGFLGMTVQESLGGAGVDYVSYALALIEIAAGDGAVSTQQRAGVRDPHQLCERGPAEPVPVAARPRRDDRRVRAERSRASRSRSP